MTDTPPIHAAAVVPNRTESATVIKALQDVGVTWIEDKHVELTHEYIDNESPASLLYPRDDTDEAVAVVNVRDSDNPGASTEAVAEHDSCNAIVTARIDDLPIDALRTAAEHGASIHAAKDRITLRANDHGLTDAAQQALTALTTTDVDAAELLDGVPWRGGRPPIGTTSRHGELRPADDYREVCRVLQAVADDGLDKTRAADRLDCTRSTIDAALRRGELYGLD
jgi:hypothetical protein